MSNSFTEIDPPHSFKRQSYIERKRGSFADSSRDHLINTVYKQHRLRQRILEPYRRIKNALKKMQDEYAQSKEDNLFARYMRMQHMIHEVCHSQINEPRTNH
ncbi:unnamed protein product [Toxocara canis]|uniref:Uncharacterized protein n=1 Tax=Toxocara canis TaxID=6265 RepID=A0A183TZW8_TOXCA|nr:unnamed protein product [Toxocara canis]